MPTKKKLLEIIEIQTRVAQLGADLGAVMNLVAERTLGLTDAEGAAVEMAEGDSMVYRAASGQSAASLGLRIPREGSLSGLCAAQGETLRCEDTETDPRVHRDACRSAGVRSMIVVPLLHGDTTVGVLKAMSAQPSHFHAADETLLELLSGVVAASMYYAARYDMDELFYRATHDPLTGLANRALLMDRLHAELAQCARSARLVAVLVIDMDGLKHINDNLGHAAGDAALMEFARRLGRISRASDTVARLGGDEFAVVLTPVETSEGVAAAMARLEEALSPPFVHDGRVLDLRASIGAALYPEDGNTLESVLAQADQRMYANKRARKAGSPALAGPVET